MRRATRLRWIHTASDGVDGLLFPALATPALVVAWGWMLAAVVVGVRQALDYRQTSHALFVCLIGWLVAFTLTAGVGLLLTTSAH